MRVARSPAILKYSAFRRPIYMVDSLAALRRIRIVSDVVKVNIVVLKPMHTKRSFDALFLGMPWMDDRLVTYWGVQAVPDVLREDGAFSPRVHSARMQVLEGEASQALRQRILEDRRRTTRFNRHRDALQQTKSYARLTF